MKIKLVPGDYLINSLGHHVCNEKGIAIVVNEEVEVDVINQEDYDRILSILEQNRVIRGLNPDGSEIQASIEEEMNTELPQEEALEEQPEEEPSEE